MHLTLKDKKLIYWLDQDSRATNKELAKKVGLSERGLAYKLAQLEKKGIIKAHTAFINTLSLGYTHYKVLVKLQNTSIEQEEALIERIKKDSNVRWIASCAGQWDINFSILAKTPQEFTKIYQKIEKEAKGAIAEKMVHLTVKAPGFTKGYIIGENSMRTLHYGKEEIVELEEFDKKLLKAISQNARKSLVQLGKELKTSLDTIRYHLKKLEKINVISGYTTWIEHEKIDVKRTAVYFSMNGMSKDVEEKMYSFAKTHNIFAFIVSMIGKYDLSLEFETPNNKGVEETLKKFRKEFGEHIKGYEIIPNTREYKYDFYPF